MSRRRRISSSSGGAANGAGVQYVGAPVVGVLDGRSVGFDVGVHVSKVGDAVGVCAAARPTTSAVSYTHLTLPTTPYV